MRNSFKNISAAVFVVIIFFIGYLRETIFLVLNSVLNKYPFPYNNSYVSPPNFLYSYSSQTLITVKWVLTFGFSILFFMISWVLIHFYFKNRRFNKITVWVYLFLVGVSFLTAALGILLGNFDETYTLSRFVIGFAQSPLIPLVLFVLFYFKTKMEQQELT
ncbi:MAG: hypothetical protein HYU68_06105 [Bacteroidetes bacterium]|nr:hypothetical protein [Bacteroidota bacterium]